MLNNLFAFQSRFMEKESRLAFTLEENMETSQKTNLGPKQSKYRILRDLVIFYISSILQSQFVHFFPIEIGMA